jgi:tellurite resistance protein
MLQRGRSAGDMIRKWKQADNKKADRLDQLIREADRFSEINPTHTDSGARIDFDKETGRYAAESMPEAVRHDSSCCSVGLSLAAFILWIFLWTEVVTQYDAQKPSISSDAPAPGRT